VLDAFEEDVNAGLVPTRALTLRNPWPWFMFHVPTEHRKTVENRSRNLGFHRQFWVHCSMNETTSDWDMAEQTAANVGVPPEFWPDKADCAPTNGRIVARVVCSAHVAPGGIVRWPANDEGKVAFASPWYFGQWGYVIESFTLVKNPVFAIGKQGFWRVPLPVLKQLEKAVPWSR
jgi:hypothetical protein